jgi:FkbM family methyltransferase
MKSSIISSGSNLRDLKTMKLSGQTLKKIINTPLNAIGFELVRKASGAGMATWIERLKLAKKLGFSPRVIVDGGAYTGGWSQDVSRLFTGAQIITVEPNPHVQDDIRRNISNIQPKPIVLNVALGGSKEKASLNIWRDETTDTGASLLTHVQGSANKAIEVDVDTLDNIAQQTGLMPDFVKLDLQGAELPALEGASRVLEHAELMMIEFGCLEAYEGRTTPRDLIDLMYENNYCLYDIVDCHYRPYDGALTGGDFLFVKNSSALRKHKGWD